MTDAVKTTTDESANSPRTAARDDTTASVRGIGATTRSNSHRQRTKPCARFDVYDHAIHHGAERTRRRYTRPYADRFRAKQLLMRFGLELDDKSRSPVRSKHRLWRWVATPSTRPTSRGGRLTSLASLASGCEPRESGRLFLGVSRPVGPAQVRSTDPRRRTEARSRERHIGPPQIGRHRGRTPPILGVHLRIR
jgi:hypothetical protein